MSSIHILQGLVVGGLILAVGLAACWHFGFDPRLMTGVMMLAVVIAAGVWAEVQTMRALRPYWRRPCTGIRWCRRFPETPKREIREFLDMFIKAFGFQHRQRLCFRPEDRVMDVYHAIYPPGSAIVDGMELESLCLSLRKLYGVDVAESWREDITLGELYERTHPAT
jgi:propanediol dehydratase small subunit